MNVLTCHICRRCTFMLPGPQTMFACISDPRSNTWIFRQIDARTRVSYYTDRKTGALLDELSTSFIHTLSRPLGYSCLCCCVVSERWVQNSCILSALSPYYFSTTGSVRVLFSQECCTKSPGAGSFEKNSSAGKRFFLNLIVIGDPNHGRPHKPGEAPPPHHSPRHGDLHSCECERLGDRHSAGKPERTKGVCTGVLGLLARNRIHAPLHVLLNAHRSHRVRA